jgi:hypothetical protein
MSDTFACICGEHGKKEMEDLITEVKQRMIESVEESRREGYLENFDEYFISKIIYDLAYDNIYIDGIAVDQWSSISSSRSAFNENTNKYEEVETAHIQCDMIEHGFALTWKYWMDKLDKSSLI